MALLWLGAGCSRPAPVAALEVAEWQAWTLPPDGTARPTPRSLAMGPRDELAVVDTAGRVLRYAADGVLISQWPAIDVTAGAPEGLAVLHDGRIVVCDTHRHRIAVFDENGRLLKTFGRQGQGDGEFIFPTGIATDPQDHLYVCETGSNDRVQKFTRDGVFLRQFGHFGPGAEQLLRPTALVWSAGKILVADAVNNGVLVFSEEGQLQGLLEPASPSPPALVLPYAIAADRSGNLLVAEFGADRVSRWSATGARLGAFGRAGSGPGHFVMPCGLAIDSQGRAYVADRDNRRVVRFRF